MKCDLCNKKATVHLTEIVDDQMSEMHLCEECARQKSLQMEQQFGLSDLLAGLTDFGKQVQPKQEVKLKCKDCGLSYDDFRKFGRLGCSGCYEHFKSHLASLLKKIHGSSQHFGKAPSRTPVDKIEQIATLQSLKNDLMKAIQIEDFELAAKLRDQIRDLEKKDQEGQT